jgi:hypothetical protein
MPAKIPSDRTAGNARLMIVFRPRDKAVDERYVLLMESPQARARNEPYLEFPKGTVNASGDFTGPKIDSMQEEIHLKPAKHTLINLTALIQKMLPLPRTPASLLEPAVRADLKRPVFLWDSTLDRKEIEGLKGRFGGRRAPNMASNIRMLDYEDFSKQSSRTTELGEGWRSYDLLRLYGDLEARLHDVRRGL